MGEQKKETLERQERAGCLCLVLRVCVGSVPTMCFILELVNLGGLSLSVFCWLGYRVTSRLFFPPAIQGTDADLRVTETHNLFLFIV